MQENKSTYTIPIILFILILSTHPVSAQEKKVFYQISIEDNGDARFIVRDIIPLATTQEVDAFKKIVRNFNESGYLQDFSKRMDRLISRASVHTGRTMKGVDYSVSIDLVEGLSPYGAITYSFTWKNFAPIENGSIVVGDVFEGGLYLFRDDAFFITIPSGYETKTVIPEPDEISDGTLKWYGPRNFGNGEPTVIISPAQNTGYGTEPGSDRNTLMGSALYLIPIIIAVILIIAYVRRKPSYVHENRRFKTDEEVVLDILKEKREILQSDIVRLTGFSKSKVSNIITVLRKKGLVEKIKIGRENLIRFKGE